MLVFVSITTQIRIEFSDRDRGATKDSDMVVCRMEILLSAETNKSHTFLYNTSSTIDTGLVIAFFRYHAPNVH